MTLGLEFLSFSKADGEILCLYFLVDTLDVLPVRLEEIFHVRDFIEIIKGNILAFISQSTEFIKVLNACNKHEQGVRIPVF